MRLLCDRCHQRLARAAAVFKTFAYEMVRDKNNLDHLHRGFEQTTCKQTRKAMTLVSELRLVSTCMLDSILQQIS